MRGRSWKITALCSTLGVSWFLASHLAGEAPALAEDVSALQADDGQTNPTTVTSITVTPSADPFQPGNMSFVANVNPGAVVLPRSPKTGEQLTLTGDKLRRVLKLEAPQLTEWQRKYVAALGKADQVLDIRGVEQFMRGAKKEAVPTAEDVVKGKVTTLVPFQGLPPLSPADEQTIIDRSLMITDLKVVEDPVRTTGQGVWTFAHLMTAMANPGETGIVPSDFVKTWLGHWQEDQKINGFTVPNRKAGIEQLILNDWPRVEQTDDLDLEKAPFRLLAIASRLDLRDNLVLGAERIGGGGAGEARFVFCAVDKAGAPLAFTVIFEYGIKKDDYQAVRDWALQWYALKDKVPGSPEYNSALEAITEQFAQAGADPESPPNRSSISQVRANEISLVADPRIRPTPPRKQQIWEVREFRLDVNDTGQLRQVTVKQTPDLQFNDPLDFGDQSVLAQFVNLKTDDLLNKRQRTPVVFAPVAPGDGFLGGSAITPPNVFWNAPTIQKPEARHLFSLGTCNGCHAAETFPKFPVVDPQFDNLQDPLRVPPHFTHVRPRKVNQKSTLSPFLTGKDDHANPYLLPDPAGQTDAGKVVTRPFHDLSDRANDLYAIVEYGTYYEFWRLPRQRTH